MIAPDDLAPLAERLAESLAAECGACRRCGLAETRQQVVVGRGNPNAYVEALRIITDPASQPVLVHCAAGAQRTSACIVLYRELVQGWPRERAMPEAYAHDHNPAKNPHLTPYLDANEARIAEAFRAGSGTLIPGQPKAEIRSPAE